MPNEIGWDIKTSYADLSFNEINVIIIDKNQIIIGFYQAIRKMQTSVAVFVIICVAIVLVFLFYIVTRYYNYRLQKSLQNKEETYSMVQAIETNMDDLRDGEYEDFAESRVRSWHRKDTEETFKDNQILANFSLRQMLSEKDEAVNNKPKLQYSQQNDPIKILPQTSRSKASVRRFQIEKLSQYQINNSTFNENKSFLHSLNSNRQDRQTQVKFISQIVCYKNNQIHTIKQVVISIFKSKVTEQIIENKSIVNKKIARTDVHFSDTLQAYGFEQNIGGAFKFQTKVFIPNMKCGNHYTVKQYRQSESKEQITIQQFKQLQSLIQQQ